jgi:hypothetical protein
MKKSIKIFDKGAAYLGKEANEQGYIGETDAFFNAVTITIIKPHTSLEDVKRSLEITIQDIELRIKAEKSEDNRKNTNCEEEHD